MIRPIRIINTTPFSVLCKFTLNKYLLQQSHFPFLKSSTTSTTLSLCPRLQHCTRISSSVPFPGISRLNSLEISSSTTQKRRIAWYRGTASINSFFDCTTMTKHFRHSSTTPQSQNQTRGNYRSRASRGGYSSNNSHHRSRHSGGPGGRRPHHHHHRSRRSQNRPNGRVRHQDPSHPYVQHVTSLIQQEKQEEEQQFRNRTERYSDQRLQREGLALFGLKARPKGSFFGKTIYFFAVEEDSNRRGNYSPHSRPFHQFKPGDAVILSEKHPVRDRRTFSGIVLESSPWNIRVVIDYLPSEQQVRRWRLDKGVNTVVYQRQEDAVKALVFRNPSSAEQEDAKFDFRNGETPLPVGTSLKPILLNSHEKGDSGQSSREDILKLASQKPNIPLSIDDTTFSPSLTASQREAVEACMQRKMTIIQGPPGTGKTFTIVQLVRSLRKSLPPNYPILVAAYTNMAVDQVLDGLLNEGVQALRIGNPIRVNSEHMNATLDSRVEEHALNREINGMREEMKELRSTMKHKRGREIGFAHRDMAKINKKIFSQKKTMMKQILTESDVVCCTCVGAASDTLQTERFGVVILDECSQITEPSALIPIVKGAEMLVLVGDTAQLPPTILSEQAARDGLNISLLERMERLGISKFLLKEQFRMHPSLSEFPSRQFYNGMVQSHSSTKLRDIPSQIPWPNPQIPIMFIDNDSVEESRDKSKLNRGQVRTVMDMLTRYLSSSGKQPATPSRKLSVGVISPYLAQVSEISKQVDSLSKDCINAEVEVKTVDGFQGREKDVIILSTVRSNSVGDIGFCRDVRRLNVAITRAKRGLIVIGNRSTLESDDTWRTYLQYLDERGLVA